MGSPAASGYSTTRPTKGWGEVNAPVNGMLAGHSTRRRFSALMVWPASRLAAAATYWFFSAGAAVWDLCVFWLSQYVNTPATTNAMMSAEASRRFNTGHL